MEPEWRTSLILLATHLAYDGNAEGDDFYTVHQWVCWDPPPRMSKGVARVSNQGEG